MKSNTLLRKLLHLLLGAGVFLLPLTPVIAQDESDDEEEGEIFELSPFEVDTSADRGYYAANTISGSRINIALQDMPMPIEVITSEFMEDTGSQDLRESLRYSSGILLTTQNPSDGIDGVPGGVHNGEGATANLTDTTIKVRGFITDSTLRKGFRRQHGSDSINIDRIEVVRGPAALLYGIGNFGGIVNYLPKRPLTFQQTTAAATIGNDSNLRGTLDTTAPINDQFAYRLTAAAETGNHWTDWQSHEKLFVSPVLQWTPDDKTKVTLDMEVGTETTDGIGFQRMRARATDLANPDDEDNPFGNVITQQGRLQMAGFAVFDGVDPRTARLSGPDTYVTTDSSNILLEAERNLLPGLDLMVGYNTASADVEKRDIINNAYQAGVGPANLRGTIEIDPFTDANGTPIYSSDGNISDSPVVNDAILMYMWQDQEITQDRKEYKAELNYKLDLFQGSRWFNMSHMFLLGLSDLNAEKTVQSWVTDGQDQTSFLYRDPNDYSPIRFGEGTLRDYSDPEDPNGITGFPDLLQTQRRDTEAGNRGYYGVWQGRFLNERITTIVGVREDNNDQSLTTYQYNPDGTENTSARSTDTPDGTSEMTYQYGITVEVFDGVSVFALQADGLEPNFEGLRDGYFNPIPGKKAKSEEIGLKLNLLDGKIAATISAYNINVVGPSNRIWYAPAPAKGRYDPTKPTTYDIGGPGMYDFMIITPTFERHKGLWDAAVAAGDVVEGEGDHLYLTVLDANGNDTAGAAFLDAMYADGYNDWGWFGWMFRASSEANTLANNASMDWAAGDVDWESSLISEEESNGYEFQVLLSPTDNWQVYMSYANTKRKLINQGAYPKYPYPQDRWAIWYFPNGGFGLNGSSVEEAYEDPEDTSTYTGGPTSRNGLQLDDTPEHDFSLWTSYDFKDGLLDGLKVGLGAYYQSEREYLSGFTVSGDRITNSENGELIQLYTQTKLQFSSMLRYDFEWNENPVWVQLNVENLTNDRDLYGFVYEAGRSWRLQAGITF